MQCVRPHARSSKSARRRDGFVRRQTAAIASVRFRQRGERLAVGPQVMLTTRDPMQVALTPHGRQEDGQPAANRGRRPLHSRRCGDIARTPAALAIWGALPFLLPLFFSQSGRDTASDLGWSTAPHPKDIPLPAAHDPCSPCQLASAGREHYDVPPLPSAKVWLGFQACTGKEN